MLVIGCAKSGDVIVYEYLIAPWTPNHDTVNPSDVILDVVKLNWLGLVIIVIDEDTPFPFVALIGVTRIVYVVPGSKLEIFAVDTFVLYVLGAGFGVYVYV